MVSEVHGSVRPRGLNYQENVIVDLGGFIVARGITHASEGNVRLCRNCWRSCP